MRRDGNRWQKQRDKAEREDFSFGDTGGSDRGHAGTAIGVEESKFMA